MESAEMLPHFLAQCDGIGKLIVATLTALSMATWYFIVVKSLRAALARRRTARFLSSFWNASSLVQVELQLEEHHPDDPFSHLAYHALVSSRHHARHGADQLNEAGSAADFITRSMRRVIDEETAVLEWGFTVLASIGSTAPFIGLFGTVWSVYHALVGIGASGAGTLDKIAGPVGEALIMTGAGLAVAIPAVLAYNGFARSNRLVLARLDGFAHDLFAFLTTGAHCVAMGEEPPGEPVATMRPVEGGA
jgi:biopolymer transport protein ExbB